MYFFIYGSTQPTTEARLPHILSDFLSLFEAKTSKKLDSEKLMVPYSWHSLSGKMYQIEHLFQMQPSNYGNFTEEGGDKYRD